MSESFDPTAVPQDCIAIDRNGDLYHEGVKITHGRTIELFLRNIVRDNDGAYRINVGRESARVVVEDVPLIIQSCDASGGRLICTTNDGLSSELDTSSMWIGGQGALYGVLSERGLQARFSRSAHVQAAQYVEPDPVDPQRFNIRLGDTVYSISTGLESDGHKRP